MTPNLHLALMGIVPGGLAAGLALCGLAGLLYETSTADLVSFGAGALALFAVAWIACYLPARTEFFKILLIPLPS